MNKLDKTYTDLLKDILDNGVKKQTRNGETISVFGRQIRHKMSDGFPLLTTKKMAWKQIVTELLWFLRGDTNIKYLVDNDCHIWVGDVYKNYCENINLPPTRTLPLGTKVIPTLYTQEEFINKIKTDDEFAKKWDELGPIYGKQWRSWDVPKILTIEKGRIENGIGTEWGSWKRNPIDQIANLINELKTNPDSRRLMVNAWNVGELDQMVLPPCHYGFQVYTRELSWEERVRYYETTFGRLHFIPPSPDALDARNIPTRAISLMWNQRSVDTFLGLPFNIASYGLLLEIIAKEVNMVPDELIGNLGDVHLYSNHVEQAKEQIGRELTIEERTSLYRKQQNLSDDVDFVGTDRDAHSVFDDYGITKRTREPYPLPRLKIKQSINTEPGILLKPELWHSDDFIIENYQSHPAIKAPLSN
jgi:thymidylate synthase